MTNVFNDYDFYYGAVLSVFLSGKHVKQYSPSLISSDTKKGRIYEFTVNHEPDFILVMAYASHPRPDTANKDYDSWSFSFTDEQKTKIKDCLDNNKNIMIAFLCGRDKWNKSELAIMADKKDVRKTMYSNGKIKKSITVRRDSEQRSYSVFLGNRQSIRLKGQFPK